MSKLNRRNFLKNLGVCSIAVSTYSLLSSCSKTGQYPNIVYIIADDLGYGDLSCENEKSKLRTKNIDSLAEEGVIFTDAHSGSAVCTPTRYGILTGRYCWRSKLKKEVLWGYSRSLIPTNRMTVASLLKSSGYKTACIGKWHLGLNWNLTDERIPEDNPEEKGDNVDISKPIQEGPLELGFDYFFGIPASLDMVPYVYIEDNKITALPDRETENKGKKFWRKGPTGADFKHIEVLPKLTQKAVEYIDKQANENHPFFLYFPLSAPHTPIIPINEFQGKSKTNEYGDFVLQVDWTVGEVIKALKRNGIDKNTMIIFASDNGCSPGADFEELAEFDHHPSYHFRGHKADIYEGGHRIPFIARWPAKIKPGSKSNETICLTDLMATCAAIVNTKLPDNAGEDSCNILPALFGNTYQKPIREATVHHSINGSFSIRQGKWKLELCPGSGGWSYPSPEKDDLTGFPPIQLYNLQNDIGEKENVYQDHPELVKRLTKLLTKYVKNGRSTPGTPQENDGGNSWLQLKWME